MIQISLYVLLAALTLYGILLIRSFEYMGLAELKRQTRLGNPEATKVYAARAYGTQLWLLLWLVIGVLVLGMILLMNAAIGTFWTIVINVPLLVVIHSLLPRTRMPKANLKLASVAGPYLERVLRLLYPILKWPERWLGRWLEAEPQQIIHSKEQLIELLHENARQSDVNRAELTIAENALVLGDKQVGDFMTPLNAINFVSSEEQLTPVVLGELHSSGHSRFPVYQGSNQNIIGTLFIKDALRLSKPKTAKEVMRPDVYYINEQQSLDHALGAFIKTRHHQFVVVNEFEDVVGIISVEDIIEQIVGKTINDEFDQYDDLREVARQVARQKHDSHATEHV